MLSGESACRAHLSEKVYGGTRIVSQTIRDNPVDGDTITIYFGCTAGMYAWEYTFIDETTPVPTPTSEPIIAPTPEPTSTPTPTPTGIPMEENAIRERFENLRTVEEYRNLYQICGVTAYLPPRPLKSQESQEISSLRGPEKRSNIPSLSL